MIFQWFCFEFLCFFLNMIFVDHLWVGHVVFQSQLFDSKIGMLPAHSVDFDMSTTTRSSVIPHILMTTFRGWFRVTWHLKVAALDNDLLIGM